MAKDNFKPTVNNIVTCVLFVLAGILLCVLKMGMLDILMTILGVLFIAYGIYFFVKKGKKDYVQGIVAIVIGVVIIICGWTIAEWVLLIFGILIAIKGAVDLIKLIMAKNFSLMSIVSAVVTVAIGILLCVAPFAIGDIICIIAGIVFIVNGVLALFGKSIV